MVECVRRKECMCLAQRVLGAEDIQRCWAVHIIRVTNRKDSLRQHRRAMHRLPSSLIQFSLYFKISIPAGSLSLFEVALRRLCRRALHTIDSLSVLQRRASPSSSSEPPIAEALPTCARPARNAREQARLRSSLSRRGGRRDCVVAVDADADAAIVAGRRCEL